MHRLARQHELCGWVRNGPGTVVIHAEGPPAALESFAAVLLGRPPALAQPRLLEVGSADVAGNRDFAIVPSDPAGRSAASLAPDFPPCPDCLRELRDPANRRYRYPFITCTQCGPRYTLIGRLPYDRVNTAMHDFALCRRCLNEYHDATDRRFHAEVLACPTCGPQLRFVNGDTRIGQTNEALTACVAALKRGDIVAVRGVGGYHLMCDARNDAAVTRLRQRKGRPHKALAVMVPEDWIDRLGLSETQLSALIGPERPIVLTAAGKGPARLPLSPFIAPGLTEIGLMLPASPLQYLLLDAFDAPLVATSGNVSGAPTIVECAEAERRLGGVTDAFLHHDRPILRHADDPVVRVIAGRPRPLRLGRGNAPLELALPLTLARPVLAVGGHQKNTIALAWDDRAVISPQGGDLDSPRALEVFEQTVAELQGLYGVRAAHLVCDAHPNYASTRWARRAPLPCSAVLHHVAHAAAVAGEYPEIETWLVFAWDGAGYGADGTLWGGEALLGRPGAWRRVASFRPFALPGGPAAARQPWRSALALYWEAGLTPPTHLPHEPLLYEAWRNKMNAPTTSSVGRLFDAAAAAIGLIHEASYEGQGPMYLEAAAGATDAQQCLPLRRRGDGLIEADWAPLLPLLGDQRLSLAQRAGQFHASLAQVLVAQTLAVREGHTFDAVGLAGGVFQNRMLTEQAVTQLTARGIRVLLPERLPGNDAGISFGQVIEFASGGGIHSLS